MVQGEEEEEENKSTGSLFSPSSQCGKRGLWTKYSRNKKTKGDKKGQQKTEAKLREKKDKGNLQRREGVSS